MKKIYSIVSAFVLLMFTGSATFAQSQRLVLAEEFTQASCGPCAAQNPAFNTLLDANSTKVVSIKYQTNWPGVDPMNAQTQTWVAPRVTYYGVSGVPHAVMDGTAQTGGSYVGAPANWTQAKINTRYAVTSPFTLTASHSFDATYSNITVTVDMACTQAAAGTFMLRVALVEKNISFCQAPGTNGEKEFYGVMRKMLPDAMGTTLATSWTVGQTQQFILPTTIPAYIYDLKKLAVVVFVQNDVTKEVFQAAISEPLPIANDASIKNCLSAATAITCGSTLDRSITITNEGTAPITSTELSYSVTGGTPQTYTANGTIAPGSSSTFALPTIALTTFPSTFTCNVVSVNGGTDYVTGNNTISSIYYQIPATAVIAPLTQDFVAATFPPVNWNRINGGGSATWTRSGVGATAVNGSTKMDYYNSAPGDIEWLFTPKVDLTNLTNPYLTFKIAKAPYTGQTDRCDVVASTDCGATWTTVWTKSDPQLSTVPAATAAFTPTSGSTTQWRNEAASLSALAGQTEVLFAFKAISGYGNNMYIDDINIESSTGLNETNSQSSISVFPTITSGDVYINMPEISSNANTVSVFDSKGQLIETLVVAADAKSQVYIDLSKYSSGVYMIQVESGSLKVVKKVMLEK